MPLYVPPSGISLADLVEELGATVASIYDTAETRILQQIQRRAARQLGRVPSMTDRLTQIRQLRADTERILAELPPNVAEQVLDYAAQQGMEDAAARLGTATNLPPGPLTPSRSVAVLALAADLQSMYDRVENRILRWEQDAWQQLTAGHVPGVLLGVDGKLTAQQEALTEWLAAGIPGFIDKAGRSWRPGTYTEMATRTAVLRAFTGASIQRMSEAGLHLVTPIVGNSACEWCAAWAGKILSTDGTPPGPTVVPHATEDRLITVMVAGTVEGARAHRFNHPNCRCKLVSYLPGLSIPAAATTYNPEREQARERQRELERRIRDKKRRQALTDSLSAKRTYAAQIRAIQADLRQHITDHDLPRKRYREQLWFTDGRQAA